MSQWVSQWVRDVCISHQSDWIYYKQPIIFELFFCKKKYLLVGASSMLWIVDKLVSQWVNQWVRDVCISHQSDWIYYKQPIKCLVVKVYGMWEDLIRIEFRTRKYFSCNKRGRSIHILGLHRHFLWVRLRILVIDEMSLEVELVVCKWNKILLFLVTKETWYFCFSQGVNSIRDHASSLLVLRKCFRVDQTILIWKSSNVYRWRPNDCFLHANVATYYFLVSKGNSTLLFFTRE